MPDEKESTVTNTSEKMGTQEGKLEFLLEAMLGGNTSDAIEAMEAKGQQELVASTLLPTKCRPIDQQALEKQGVVFGEVQARDHLFRKAALPEGWVKKATHHAMWSEIHDPKGRIRAKVFYKAAYYDRSATLHAVPRFQVTDDYDDNDGCICRVLDGAEILFETERFSRSQPPDREDPTYGSYKSASEKAHTIAEGWLTEKYPLWKDPSAYWDE